jgi:hypothetical protein
MPGLDPGIHDFLHAATKNVDGGDKPGHDERGNYRQCNSRVSSRLISLPTASPNSDRMTTPANS